MNEIMEQISRRVRSTGKNKDFLDLIFGDHKEEVLDSVPVVLFGAGSLGNELAKSLRKHDIRPVCFCDTNDSRCGTIHSSIPVISFDELCKSHRGSLVLLSVANSNALGDIEHKLLTNGFAADRIMGKKSDLNEELAFIQMYANSDSICESSSKADPESLLSILEKDESRILSAYRLFADDKSRELLIERLALVASNIHYSMFRHFISRFSEPIRVFGLKNRLRETEEYFYFNNDVMTLSPQEIYVDVGAADGDTVHKFVQAAISQSVDYRRVHAFEPDPTNFQDLVKNTRGYRDVRCHELGLWSETKTLTFLSSDNAEHSEGGSLSNDGDIKVNVVALDDLIKGEEVSFIKMDMTGNVIPEAIRGASEIISKYKPKLAFGVNHSFQAVFEIPLLVKSLGPDYKMYLRHNSCHIYDTVLYAVA